MAGDAPRVLVTGDQLALRAQAAEALESAGIRVCVGAEPGAALDGVRPDVAVIAGARDPAVACTQARALPVLLDVPLLLLLAESEGPGVAAALGAGADDVLRGALDPVVLIHRVAALLDANRLRGALDEARGGLAELERVARLARFECETEGGDFHGSPALRMLLGLPPGVGPVAREELLDCLDPEDRDLFETRLEKSEEAEEGFALDTRLGPVEPGTRVLHWRVEHRAAAAGRPALLTGTVQDLSERRQAERQLRYLTDHDGLTGLTSRAAFLRALGLAVRGAAGGESVALLVLDVDNFKRVNETLGHSAGDHLLRDVAQRLEGCLRTDPSERRANLTTPLGLARLGADEIGVLLEGVDAPETIGRVARRILAALREPFAIEGTDLIVSASIGIAMHPADGDDVDTLLRSAQAAMYRAKERGRNNFRFYTEAIADPGSRRYALEQRLCRAFENHELSVFYQPQVEMATGRIVGVEALLRWTDPDYGAISPAEFVPLAEEAGLIRPIGEWVLRTACWQAKAWRDAGLPATRVAVNVSPHHFENDAFPSLVSQTLWDTGLQSGDLELEITENVLMRNQDHVVGLLRELKALGVTVSLDDFGTGYSSLSYLKRFPVDAVKIDRSFVRDIGIDVDDAAITDAIISMAKALRLRVVAEGVETDRQRDFLRARGCDEMQGYLFSPPVDAESMEALLEAQPGEAGSVEPTDPPDAA